jgi:hypothetical protein
VFQEVCPGSVHFPCIVRIPTCLLSTSKVNFVSFFTLTGIGLELWSYWSNSRANTSTLHDKPRRGPESTRGIQGPGPEASLGPAGGPPLDAPAEATTHNV